MPPLSVQLDANSAETSALGIRNTIAENTKKKINVLPNKAAAGKFRMLSTAPMINITRAKVDNFAV